MEAGDRMSLLLACLMGACLRSPSTVFAGSVSLPHLAAGGPKKMTVYGRVSFPAWNQADPKSDRWPIAQYAAGDLTTTDGSQVGALEPIYNPGEQTIVVLVSL
jgi:hypothetical protein